MRWVCVLSICILLMTSVVSAINNPSAAYCEKMGYEYKVKETPLGEDGICVANGIEFNAWDFLNGKVGKEYSYCAKHGYDVETVRENKNGYPLEYAVCVRKESGNKTSNINSNIANTLQNSQNSRKIMVDLMKLNGDGLLDKYSYDLELNIKKAPGVQVMSTETTLPSSFDWRNVNGSNWMTPVKNQRSCGSCWAFAAASVAEARLNIDLNNPNADYDLSEQQLVSCSGAGSCRGGDPMGALAYAKSSGLVRESYFPYVAMDIPCSLGSGWESNAIKISGDPVETGFCVDDWMLGPSNCNESQRIAARNSYKRIIMNMGPSVAIIDAYDITGFESYRGLLHAVTIVGWNDSGGYWIIKNSWGTSWGDGGYYRLPYNSSLYGIIFIQPPTHDVPEFDWLGVLLVLAGGLAVLFWRGRAR